MSADFTDRAPLLRDPQPLQAPRPVPPDPWPMVPTALVFVFAIFLIISILLFACRRFANTNASPPSTWQRNQHVPPPPPLCPDAVAALPLVRAGAGNELSCCAVCLAEHEEGETVKLMPACGHVFHPECIDTWLLSHGTCPVCRCSELSGSRTREVRVDVFESIGEGDEREEQRSDLLRAIGRSRSCSSRVEVEGNGFAMVFLRRSCSF